MAAVPSKVDEITAVLRTEILRGQYRCGERLPSERDLAARFEANRGAIRESLKKLEQIGIASITPGGVRVMPLESATLDVLGALLELGDDVQKQNLMNQVIDVLGAMMSLSARSAITVASDTELEELTVLLDQLLGSVGDDEAHAENWMAVGEKMMSIHQNLVLRLVGNGLRTQFLSKLNESDRPPELDPEAIHQTLTSFRDATASRNALGASRAIIEHFQIISNGIRALEHPEDTSRSAKHV